MVDLIGLVHNICDVYKYLQNMQDVIISNGKQCESLLVRLGIFNEPLKRFAAGMGSKEPSQAALTHLLMIFEKARSLLDEYCGASRTVKALRCFAFSQRFLDITLDLDRARSDLGFCENMNRACHDRMRNELKSDLRIDFDDLSKEIEDNHDPNDRRAYEYLRRNATEDLVGFREIDFERVTIANEADGYLGRGSFGKVRTGLYETTKYAVKEIVGGEQLTPEDVRDFRREIAIHAGLRFESIVQLWGACTITPNLCLLMELAPFGDLFALLHVKRAYIPWTHKCAMLRDVAGAIAYLHSKSILHRDIKAQNILVFDNLRLKVCDFGQSKVKTAIQRSQTRTCVGTLQYLPPEVHVRRTVAYESPGDIYSLSIVMYEMITRKRAFPGESEHDIRIAVCSGTRPPVSYPIDAITEDHPKLREELVRLMEKCWQQQPEERMTSEALRDALHAVLADNGGDTRDAFSYFDAVKRAAITPLQHDSQSVDAGSASNPSAALIDGSVSVESLRSIQYPPAPPASRIQWDSESSESASGFASAQPPPLLPPRELSIPCLTVQVEDTGRPQPAPASVETVTGSWREDSNHLQASSTERADTIESPSCEESTTSEFHGQPMFFGSLSSKSGSCLRYLKHLKMHPAELKERWDFILAVMQESPTDAMAQGAAFACVPFLCLDDNKIMENLGNGGACHLAVKALGTFNSDASVLGKVLYAIACLSRIEANRVIFADLKAGEANRVSFATLTTGEEVIKVMQSGGVAGKLHGWGAKKDAAADGFEYLVQQYGCLSLANLSLNADIRRQLGDSGAAFPVIVKAMKKHISIAAVQEFGSGALGNLLIPIDRKESSGSSKQLSSSRGPRCEAIVNAMTHHKTMVRVQKNCCKTIVSMCRDNADRSELGAHGGCEAVVQALLHSDVEVQAAAIHAVYALSRFDESNAIKLSRTQALEKLEEVVDSYAANPELHQCARSAINSLTDARRNDHSKAGY